MATQTDKLAPRIIINENDVPARSMRDVNPPVTLIFGFAPIGKTCEMVYCNNITEIRNEFGFPTTAPEKYFIDAGMRVVQQGATAIMTRLPYDNDQQHRVKYVDYQLEDPIAMNDLATVPAESKAREKDDAAVTVLKEMHELDHRMTQVQRVSQISDEFGTHIHSMSNEELVELELDPQANLEENTFRIVDIRGEQYRRGAGGKECVGIFPILTSAPMALYYQQKLSNNGQMDAILGLVDVSEGIEIDSKFFRTADPVDNEFKIAQATLVSSIHQELNFNTKGNKFHRGVTFQDECARRFPAINLLGPGKLNTSNVSSLGLLVCQLRWDADEQISELVVLESFVGRLGRTQNSIDKQVNAKSQYVRMYKNIQVPVETDFFMVNNQKITVLGMDADECSRYINYKTSIIDPVTYMLESVYSDVDSIRIDTILDAGLSSTAFMARVERTDDGESFLDNDTVRTRVDWTRNEYPPEEYVQEYANAWNEVTQLFGDFIKNVRGDCVYIADGPRILNLEHNYPIRNYTDMENTEMFHKFLPLFSGYTNNYVARYWNWVYIEDMQYDNRGFWVPGSVVMGGQLAYNDHSGEVWYAPAGQSRGLVPGAYDVSVKTKQYNDENDLLYQSQWNFFNIYQNEGVVVEGQKTLQTKKTALDRLNTRRMVCWIKYQLRSIANRYKYEPHTTTNRQGFTRDVNTMLQQVQRTSGISEYVIKCDESNNTMETIDRHELHMKVAIKPIKAIEYILIDLDILNGQVGIGNENTVVANN